VLKTSAVSKGRFYPEENKAVWSTEVRRASEPVRGGSILFSRMNTPNLVGESCYVAEDHPTLFLPDRLWQLRAEPDAPVSMNWLAYVLQGSLSRRFIQDHATGTSATMKNFSKASLRAIPVRLPPVPEQVQIAAVLETLDDRISATEEILNKLRLIKQGLLQRLMFRKGSGASVEIRQLADTYAGGTPPRSGSHLYGGEIPWAKSAELNQGSISTTEETITERALESSSVRWVPSGVPLIAMYGATAGVVSWTKIRLTTNQAVLALVPRTREVNPRWLYWALVHHAPKILSSVQGSGQPNLSKGIIDGYELVVPSIEEQQNIADILDSNESRMDIETAELDKIRAFGRGLTSDLISGRVRVSPEGAS